MLKLTFTYVKQYGSSQTLHVSRVSNAPTRWSDDAVFC